MLNCAVVRAFVRFDVVIQTLLVLLLFLHPSIACRPRNYRQFQTQSRYPRFQSQPSISTSGYTKRVEKYIIQSTKFSYETQHFATIFLGQLCAQGLLFQIFEWQFLIERIIE